MREQFRASRRTCTTNLYAGGAKGRIGMQNHQIRSILLILLLAPGVASLAEAGEVQFAGDHYKVQGGPKIDVSVINPVFSPGSSGTLRLVLANDGMVEGLVPGAVPPGSEGDAAQEMLAEFRCLEASNLRVDLHPAGPVRVLSGQAQIDLLGPGNTSLLEFEIDVEEDAEGPVLLSLQVEYEHQTDVTFSGGAASPLYLPSSLQLDLILSAEGDPTTLKLLSTRSDLSPGEEGSISLIVGNAGRAEARNCTVRLLAAPPVIPISDRSFLGDIPPGGAAVARFDVRVEGSAQAQEYRIGCEIGHEGGLSTLSFPLLVAHPEEGRLFGAQLAGPLLIAAALAAIWIMRKRANRSPWSRGNLRPRR